MRKKEHVKVQDMKTLYTESCQDQQLNAGRH